MIKLVGFVAQFFIDFGEALLAAFTRLGWQGLVLAIAIASFLSMCAWSIPAPR